MLSQAPIFVMGEYGWTASELAGLPGMPGKKSGVRRLAERQRWSFCSVRNRGGTRREYALECLPQETQAALKANGGPARQLAVDLPTVLPGEDKEEAVISPISYSAPEPAAVAADQLALSIGLADNKPAEGGREAARLEVLQLYEEFREQLPPMGERAAAALFVGRWMARLIDAPGWLYQQLPEFSDTSLVRWSHASKERRGRRGRPAICNGDVAELLEALIHEYPHASIPKLLELAKQRIDASRLPSLRTCERWIAEYRRENSARMLAYLNPDGYRSKHGAAFGTYAATRPNERWELDSTPTDVMLATPDGKRRRYVIVGGTDVYTHRLCVVIAPTSSSEAIAALLRKMLLAWGLPETVVTDQGKDYASFRIKQTLRELGVRHKPCKPFSPQSKPYVERALGDLSHGLLPLLPGYIGHDVATRKAIEGQRSFAQRLSGQKEPIELNLSPEQLQQQIDGWLAAREQQPHSSLGCSPLEAWLKAGAPKMAVPDERALDVLLAPLPTQGGWRTVQKRGLQVEGGLFLHEALALFEGKRVRCKLDLEDMGLLYVFDEEDKFVCIAEDAERLGIKRAEVAAHARNQQAKANSEHRAKIKRLSRKHQLGREVVADYLEAQAQRVDQVHVMRTNEQPAEATAAMSAATEAASERAGRKQVRHAPPLTAEEQQHQAERQARPRKSSKWGDSILDEIEEVILAGDNADPNMRAWVEDLCRTELVYRRFVAQVREQQAELRRAQ